jgi:hypothetical protein
VADFRNAATKNNPMSTELIYFHLPPDSPLPVLRCLKTRVVVVIDAAVSREWQWQTSKWIIAIGCQYMMAWGIDCTSWDDSVDYAHLEKYDFHYERIPPDDFVVTTWHDDVPLAEVFRYAKGELAHPHFELNRIVILDITRSNRCDEITEQYFKA